MRLAIVGDIHHYRLFVPPWRLLNKRLLGQTNLWLNRRRSIDRSLLTVVLERAASVQPDMLLLTGDLTTTSLEGEFADVAAALEPIGQRTPILIVPGNHDRYTFASVRQGVMERELTTMMPRRWPCVRPLTSRWRLLALDSAVPRLFNSRGRLGKDQLVGIRACLQDLTPEHGLVVLCHYPIKTPPKALPMTWDHGLADARRLKRLLIRCPARVLFVHGHLHKPWCWQPKRSNQSHFTYINAGAPCMTSTKYPRGQGFWQIDLPDDPLENVHVSHHLPIKPEQVPSTGHEGTPLDPWKLRRVL